MFTIHFRLLLCPLSELGRPIQLILQITFATKCDYITVPFFSLRPCAARSSGTNQTLRLTGLSTLFKASYLPTKFCPPREVLTSSENSMMRVKIFLCLLKAPGLLSQRTEMMRRRKRFCFSFLPTQSASFPSFRSYPSWNAHLHLAASLNGQSWRWKIFIKIKDS